MRLQIKEEYEGRPAASKSAGFGRRGWGLILFSLVMYYNFAAWTTDGLNLFTEGFGTLHGWDPAELLAYSTPSGWLGIIGGFVFGQLVMSKGVRFSAVAALVMGGIATIWFGRVESVFSYAIAIMLMSFFATGYGFVVPGTLINNWFPQKKGMALGWATMGMPLCTATFVPLMVFLFERYGLPNTMAIMGGTMVLLALLALFWIKETPEEAGVYPDNDPSSTHVQTDRAEREAYVSPFTLKVLVKDKNMWLISLGFGCLWMVTVGIVSQLIPRLLSIGYDLDSAILMLSSAAVCALPGSLFWGWLDQRKGTRIAGMVYAIMYIATLILLIVQGGTVLTFLTVLMVGIGLGGIKNLIPSMVGSIYGRYDFPAANRLITPIASLVRVCAFALIAVGLKITGSYTGAYLIFIAIDLLGLFLISRIAKTGNESE
ncbi:MFS transporter [Brevibacillus fluminis]|uniref:MFS transporter n=1 Tax=Brevibacillus fluminis TaxID=511487 RepID=UPI003F8C73B5